MKEGRKESKREANTNCLSLSPPPQKKSKLCISCKIIYSPAIINYRI